MGYLSRTMLSAAGVLVLGAGAASYVFLGPYRAKVEATWKQMDDARLFRFDPGAVTGGTLWSKGRKVVFARGGRGWKIVEPVEALGDNEMISRMIEAVASVRTDAKLQEETTQSSTKDDALSKYGLDDPSLKIALELAGGKKLELWVGIKNEFDGRYYVKDAASVTVGMAEGGFLAELDRDVYTLREKRISFFDTQDVTALELRHDGKMQFRLQKSGSDWRLTAPEQRMADALEAIQLVEAVRGIRAKSFADDSGSSDPELLARFGLQAPAYVLNLALSRGSTLSIQIGAARDEISHMHWYARVDGERPLVEIHETLYKSLDHPPVDFYDRRVLSVGAEQVALVRLQSERGSMELERQGAGWALRAPKNGAARAAAVGSLIYALANLRAKRFDTTTATPSDLKRTGLSTPEATVSFRDAAGAELGSVLVGKLTPTGPKDRYVMAKGTGRIDIVDAAKLPAWPSPEEMLEATGADAGRP